MSHTVTSQPLTGDAVAGLAEVIEVAGAPDKLINQGHCGRFHDRALLDVEGTTGLSLFQSKVFALPFKMEMMERHPHGSQAFVPMSEGDYLVVLAEDENGAPGTPRACVAKAGQAVNIGRNVWHSVLCPLSGSGLFAVIDRVTDSPNLEEHWFKEAWTIT